MKKNYYKINKLNKPPKWLNKNKQLDDRFVSKLVLSLSKYIANDETLSMQRLSEMVLLYQDTKSKYILNTIFSNIFGWILMYLLNVKRKYRLSQQQFEDFFSDAFILLERCCENYKPSEKNTFLTYYRSCIYWIIEHTKLRHKNLIDLYSLSYIDNFLIDNNTNIINYELHKEFENQLEQNLMLNNVFNYVLDNFEDKEIIYFIKYVEKLGLTQNVILKFVNENNIKKLLRLMNKRVKNNNKEIEDKIFEKLNKMFELEDWHEEKKNS